GGLDRAMAGHHDELLIGSDLQGAAKRFDPVHFRHPDIEEDQVRRLGLYQFERFLSALRGRDIVALILENPGQGIENRGLIINDQNTGVHVALLMWAARW